MLFVFVWIVGAMFGDAIFWASISSGLLLFAQGPNRATTARLLLGSFATEIFFGLTVGPLLISVLAGSFLVQLIRRMFLFPQWTASEHRYFLFDIISGLILGYALYIVASFVRTILIS